MSLNDAGLTGAAKDAEKMKKGDAAEHAESWLKDTRWVPSWLRAPQSETPSDDTESDNTTLAA
ncbi:hypothetical protein D3C80_1437020 [compost metagenome]